MTFIIAQKEQPQARRLEITLDGAEYTHLIVSLDHPDAAKTP